MNEISNLSDGLKVVCEECNGTGKVNRQSSMIQKPNCPECKGKGYVIIEWKNCISDYIKTQFKEKTK